MSTTTKTRPPADIAERLTQAQHDTEALRVELAGAEGDLKLAVEEQRYTDAEQAKARVDEIRPHLLIAAANAGALQQAASALDEHRRTEERATVERERREQAAAQYETAKASEAAALDDVQRLLAEVPAALAALQQTMHEAIEAEQRVGEARRHMHISGVAAGWIDPQTPPPARPNMASARFEHSALFVQILRAPRQSA